MKKNNNYARRGVSTQKEDVQAAVKDRDKGLYPNAFCTVLPDIHGGFRDDWCYVQHADGAGTKSSLAYLYWKETGDVSVFKGIAQDAAIMNIDDLLCIGAVDNITLSSTIGRNKHLVPGEVVVSALIEGFDEVADLLTCHVVRVHVTGGETADVGDLVRSVIVDATASVSPCRARTSWRCSIWVIAWSSTPSEVAEDILRIFRSFGVEVRIIGWCECSNRSQKPIIRDSSLFPNPLQDASWEASFFLLYYLIFMPMNAIIGFLQANSLFVYYVLSCLWIFVLILVVLRFYLLSRSGSSTHVERQVRLEDT